MAYLDNVSINNDGLAIYGELAQLQINFWNGAVVFKLFPAIPVGERQEGRAKYDYKKRMQATITADNAVIIGQKIIDELVPAARKGEHKHVGVSSAGVNMVYISTGKNSDKIQPFVGIMNDIGADHIPARKMIMPLSFKRLFTKYDDETGEFEIDDDPVANLLLIGKFLANCVQLYGATVHAEDCQHYKRDESDMSFKNAVASKLGINFTQPVNYISRRETPTDPFANAISGGSSMPKPASASTLDDITGLL